MSQTRDVKYGGVTWEVEYNYIPGCAGRHTLQNGDPGYPEEPAEVEVLRVFLSLGKVSPDKPVDLSEFLDEGTWENIEARLRELDDIAPSIEP